MESTPHRSFRADVQGLRAIAVLTVIAGHAGVPFLPGGFVGVDVFFVISGFLISQLLFREVARNGGVSLKDFYARRARRILPAATLVTVVTLVASLIWLSIVDALSLVTDALWATFFAANFRFAAVGTDYFAAEEGPSPLQHYWSLAVEEQFYLVWPLLLIGCLWLAKRRRDRIGDGSYPKRTILAVLAVLGVASFGYGVWLTSSDPTSAYFSTPARAWELAIGALAAIVAPWIAARLSNRERGALAVTGLVAIATACVFFDSGTAFPGVAALGPVLGAAALLIAGAGTGEAVDQPAPVRALSVTPMRVIGDWSYSLYLWHWPLLVIPELRLGRDLSTRGALIAVALTFVLAALTYRFVETPFRSAKRIPRPRALALYPASVVLVALSCVVGSVYGHWRAGEFGDRPGITVTNFGGDEADYDLSKNPTVALVQASVIAARNNMAVPSDLSPDLLKVRLDVPQLGDCDYTEDVRNICERGDTDGDKTVVILGNSHGRMWIPAVDAIAKREGYKGYYFVKSNCTAADLEIGDLANDNEPWAACSDFREWAFDQIERLQPDLVIVAASGPNPVIYGDDGEVYRKDDERRYAVTEKGWESTFTRLKAMAGKVALIRDVPKNEDEPGVCLTTGSPDLGDCMFTPLPEQELDSDTSTEAAEATDTQWIDPRPWLCWEDECPVVIGKVLPYRDRGHLTTVYSESLADDLGEKLGIWTE